jgi:hypothetical protein
MRPAREPETPEEQKRLEKKVRERQARRLREPKMRCLGPCGTLLPESDFPLCKSADGEDSFRQAICLNCGILLRKEAEQKRLKAETRRRNRARTK